MTRFMANRNKNDADVKALENYMRFLRLCKVLLTDNGTQFDLKMIRPGDEFYDLMVQWAKADRIDICKADPSQTDAVMLDMLYDAWNDINVGGKIDINIKVHERGKDS